MGASVREDLENYIYVAREKILSFKENSEKAFFVSVQAKRLCANQIVERLHKLKATARISKLAGIHSLRHSIATHLLQSGMTLEEVSRFLGNSSLESTQIYTHIANEIIY
jgi:site-specific recombinase XerD